MSDLPLVVEPGSQAADFCVIWLHGLGADGHDFEPIVPELRLDPDINIRFIFPHAPMMAVTINQGFVMRAWYDIRENRIEAEQDEAGIRESDRFLNQMIEEQVAAGIAEGRNVLAGFLPGVAVSPFMGVCHPGTRAGGVGSSPYLPPASSAAA